jgi:hypothetical protein
MGTKRGCDAGKERVTRIGGDHAARSLGAVEGESIGAQVWAPERAVEQLVEISGFPFLGLRFPELAERPSHPRSVAARGIDIGLYLAQRDGTLRQVAIGVEDRIDGILPALVDEAVVFGAAIFDEPVGIAVTEAINPRERCLDAGPDRLDGPEVAVRLR